MNGIKLVQGDCRDALSSVPDNSIDLILTDPPYNAGLFSRGNIKIKGRADINNDIALWDKELFKPEEYIDEFCRTLKKDGNLFCFAGLNQISHWYDLLKERFDSVNYFIWHKTNPTPSFRKKNFLNSCEFIFCCWNRGHKWRFKQQKLMHNFFESSICMGRERLKEPKHPTQKPVGILKHLISIATDEDDCVLDPFMGVGSVGVAAKCLNRRFIGIEKDESYFNGAKKRLYENENENENY